VLSDVDGNLRLSTVPNSCSRLPTLAIKVSAWRSWVGLFPDMILDLTLKPWKVLGKSFGFGHKCAQSREGATIRNSSVTARR